MYIEPIFVIEGTTVGLHSIGFGSKSSEFANYYGLLNNATYVRQFCHEHLDKQKRVFYGKTMEEIIKDVLAEAQSVFLLLSTNFRQLDSFFKPLSKDPKEDKLQKLKPDEDRHPKSKIRVYAIKLADNTYIFTGAAIKITEKIRQHPDTARERKKMIRVRDWLLQEKILDTPDLKLYYVEQ